MASSANAKRMFGSHGRINGTDRCGSTERPLTHRPELAGRQAAMQATRRCSIDGCDYPIEARGWCSKHYTRWKRYGSPEDRQKLSTAERFWSHVDKISDHACWIWTGYQSYNGYGFFGRSKNKTVRAHRLAYEQLVGPIPPGLTLDHLCENRLCVNPTHLVPATIGENALRGNGPAALNKRKTHCSKGHEFTPENTYMWRGHRQCRTCQRLRNRELYRKKGVTDAH